MPKILIRPRDGLSVYVLNDDTNGLLSSYANGYAKAGRDACVADAINYSDAETYFDEVARLSRQPASKQVSYFWRSCEAIEPSWRRWNARAFDGPGRREGASWQRVSSTCLFAV